MMLVCRSQQVRLLLAGEIPDSVSLVKTDTNKDRPYKLGLWTFWGLELGRQSVLAFKHCAVCSRDHYR